MTENSDKYVQRKLGEIETFRRQAEAIEAVIPIYENHDCCCLGPQDGEDKCPCAIRSDVRARLVEDARRFRSTAERMTKSLDEFIAAMKAGEAQ